MNKDEQKNKSTNRSLQFKVVEDKERDNVLSFIGSNESPDRQGDVVVASGWDIENYKKNPVFLWGHDYGTLPVGKAINVFVDKATKALMFDIEFAVNEYPFAETVYKLYKGGFLNAVSVGFMVKDFHLDDDGIWYIDESELLELSAVTVPANPSALLAGMKKGLFSDKEIKELNKHMDYDVNANKKIAESKETKDTEILGEEENDMPEQKVTVELDLDTTKAEKKLDALFARIKELSESKEVEVEEVEKEIDQPAQPEEIAKDEEVVVEETKVVEEATEVAVEEEVVEDEEKVVEDNEAEAEETKEEVAAEEEISEEVAIDEETVKEEENNDDQKSLTDALIKSVTEKLKEEIK